MLILGMGFTERNDAFDFWAALLDFSERIKNENAPVVEASGPDLSHLRLQEGQTFSLGTKPASSMTSRGKHRGAPNAQAETSSKIA